MFRHLERFIFSQLWSNIPLPSPIPQTRLLSIFSKRFYTAVRYTLFGSLSLQKTVIAMAETSTVYQAQSFFMLRLSIFSHIINRAPYLVQNQFSITIIFYFLRR